MSNSLVQVPADSVGKKIDTEQQTVGSNVVQRQRMITVPGADPQGCSVAHRVANNSVNAVSVKTGPGQVYGWSLYNNGGSVLFVKLHNTAGAPTAGTGVVKTIAVQAGQGVEAHPPHGIAFDTGIAFTMVEGVDDTDANAVPDKSLVFDLYYK